MDRTSYLKHWAWLGLAMLVFTLLSPSAVLVGLALWLHWQRQVRWRWVVAGQLLVASWAGLVLLWGTLAGQFVALSEAITGYTGLGALLMRSSPVWGEGTLLGQPSLAWYNSSTPASQSFLLLLSRCCQTSQHKRCSAQQKN